MENKLDQLNFKTSLKMLIQIVYEAITQHT